MPRVDHRVRPVVRGGHPEQTQTSPVRLHGLAVCRTEPHQEPGWRRHRARRLRQDRDGAISKRQVFRQQPRIPELPTDLVEHPLDRTGATREVSGVKPGPGGPAAGRGARHIMSYQSTVPTMKPAFRGSLPERARLLHQGALMLLEIKDSDIRISALEQCRDAVDKGIHAGGAFSAVIPLVALFHGSFIELDVEEPTRRGQDMFVLSKGHAVVPLASIYAELGYFDRRILKNSRSHESILNGHPGPILPGVHISTGPLGQGLSVAQGFALAGKSSPKFDVFCLTGDGELQEGLIWEAVMYSVHKRLDNLCVLVDQNNGQLDIVDRMIFPLPDLEAVFHSFGWQVRNVDATQYDGVCAALDEFKHGPRNGKPTAIVCHSTKGFGGFSRFLNGHKVAIGGDLMEQEMALQAEQRQRRVDAFASLLDRVEVEPR